MSIERETDDIARLANRIAAVFGIETEKEPWCDACDWRAAQCSCDGKESTQAGPSDPVPPQLGPAVFSTGVEQ